MHSVKNTYASKPFDLLEILIMLPGEMLRTIKILKWI